MGDDYLHAFADYKPDLEGDELLKEYYSKQETDVNTDVQKLLKSLRTNKWCMHCSGH